MHLNLVYRVLDPFVLGLDLIRTVRRDLITERNDVSVWANQSTVAILFRLSRPVEEIVIVDGSLVFDWPTV